MNRQRRPGPHVPYQGNRRPTIALTSRLALTQAGGIEAAVTVIAERLARERPDWNVRTVHAFTKQTRWNQIPFAGDFVAALLLAFHSRGAAVVLVNGAEYAWPQLIAAAGRRRTIVVWHGTRAGEIPALVERMTFPVRVYLQLETWLQRIALFANRQVAVSVSTIAEIRETYGYREEIALIPNGADVTSQIRTVQPNRDHVAWIGTTPYKKGLDIAIEACVIARRARPSLRLVAIGLEPPAGPRYSWIEYAGRVDRATAMHLLDRCSMLLGTSRYEGCSMAIIEALARGLPIVASPTIAWMIDGAGIPAGDYEPASFAAALETVLSGDEVRSRFAKSGPERAAYFDWDAAVKAYVREIEACL